MYCYGYQVDVRGCEVCSGWDKWLTESTQDDVSLGCVVKAAMMRVAVPVYRHVTNGATSLSMVRLKAKPSLAYIPPNDVAFTVVK